MSFQKGTFLESYPLGIKKQPNPNKNGASHTAVCAFQKGSILERTLQTLGQSATLLAGKQYRPRMKIGYARVSTPDQKLHLQIDALRAQGCDKIFKEKKSGSLRNRAALKRAMLVLKPGDTLVVWKLDRLGRSLEHLIDILKELNARNIHFHSITDGIDTSTAMGVLVFHILAAIAEFSNSTTSERTEAGMAAAKRRGKAMGRPRCLQRPKDRDRILALVQRGVSVDYAAARLKVGRTTAWRAMARERGVGCKPQYAARRETHGARRAA